MIVVEGLGQEICQLRRQVKIGVIIYRILLYFFVGVSYVNIQRLYYCLCFMIEKINI